MPKRDDIKTILLIGSGPIVIGQGCEFDYSGTQACKALRADGFRVVLVNSNPATIMTDPEFADRTYIEPITPEFIDAILTAEREAGTPVDALLPTLGGQTGLNCAMEAHERGILKKHGVQLIGASPEAIAKAEDRQLFKEAMLRIGLDVPKSGTAHTLDEARQVLAEIGLPCAIRPAYTLGGEGGGFAQSAQEFEKIAARGLAASRVGEILIEESLYGWKEFELEVIRDRNDNVVIVCSIENFDAMGVHTGDSITVAPAQTLTDREYQQMRDAAKAILREIGVDTGGSNVQFGVDPRTGRQVVIEMNPRVSRSSALASKATGYPIAKVAAKLAVGYTLDEIPNDITGTTPASFEPAIDYVVVKIPRFAFEKFPEADETLTTHMKSVGEAMAIGRTFKEAFQKCVRSMEIQRAGYGLDRNDRWLLDAQRRHAAGETGAFDFLAERHEGQVITGSRQGEAPPDTDESHATHWPIDRSALEEKLRKPSQGRPYYIRYAFKLGWTVAQVHELSHIDPWFLDQLKELVEFESDLLTNGNGHGEAGLAVLRRSRTLGYSRQQLAQALHRPAFVHGLTVDDNDPDGSFKLVDTCAAEFEAKTPYYYSTHEEAVVRVEDGRLSLTQESELAIKPQPHVVVIGGGPNRIGQGIEFDYCCVHAAFEAKRLGFRTVMINSNPETVSTDYDTSDLLFFEPLTLEDVVRILQPIAAAGMLHGVVVQFGGQTALNLAEGLKRAGAPILGTPPESIHLAEDRDEFQKILRALGLRQPENGIARNAERGVRHRRAHRLPGADPPQLRAGRARHGALQQRAGPVALHFGGVRRDRPHRRVRSADDPGGQVPARRDRDRRRRGRRLPPARRCRRRGGDLRRNGAHRAGRHPQRRQLVLHPAALALAAAARGDAPADALDGEGHRRLRVDERAVRGRRRRDLRAGGQPARLAHRAVRQQGHRRAVGQGRDRGDARPQPARRSLGVRRLALAARADDRRQGAGVPVPQVSRSRRGARPGDAQHRRGHGHGGEFRHRVCQGGDRVTPVAAHNRQRAGQRQRP